EGLDFALTRLNSFAIATDTETISNAWAATRHLAERYQLTIYDAAYLEIAVRRKIPLATLDRALIAAAKSAGVGLFATK
ncbi:MAG: type II toxin-antitoxin system VapC family toxin, partial [Puniceicoccales bacterium]|nr:type II toxin-antitoxin system VapC family toxin [Puniceicoccales bacterium]